MKNTQCHGCVKWRVGSFFFLVSGVRGQTPPALFVLLLFEQIRVLDDACVCACVVCTTAYPGRAGQAPFCFMAPDQTRLVARRSQYPPSARCRDEELRAPRRINPVPFIATYRPRCLVLFLLCVFTSTLSNPLAPRMLVTMFQTSSRPNETGWSYVIIV